MKYLKKNRRFFYRVASGILLAVIFFSSLKDAQSGLTSERQKQASFASYHAFRDWQNLQNNRRESEYTENPSFADFVVKELVPKIDSTYKTIPSPDERYILGVNRAIFFTENWPKGVYFCRVRIVSGEWLQKLVKIC